MYVFMYVCMYVCMLRTRPTRRPQLLFARGEPLAVSLQQVKSFKLLTQLYGLNQNKWNNTHCTATNACDGVPSFSIVNLSWHFRCVVLDASLGEDQLCFRVLQGQPLRIGKCRVALLRSLTRRNIGVRENDMNILFWRFLSVWFSSAYIDIYPLFLAK